MSVKGLNIAGQIQKYDYNALENRLVSAELDDEGIASFKDENGVVVFTLDLSELEGGGGAGNHSGRCHMISRAKAYALRALIEKAAVSLSDTDALDAVELFPAWAVGVSYALDVRVRYGDKLFSNKRVCNNTC